MCPILRSKIELSNIGERASKSHAKGKTHCERLALYTESDCIMFPPLPKGSVESSGSSSTSIHSSTLDNFAVPEATKDAEIWWCLKNMVFSYSYRSSDGLADLFTSVFPDSTSAEKFFLQKDKCAYFINYGIGPHFRSIFVSNVKNSEFHAVSFDESLNTVIQMGQITVAHKYHGKTFFLMATLSFSRQNSLFSRQNFLYHGQTFVYTA